MSKLFVDLLPRKQGFRFLVATTVATTVASSIAAHVDWTVSGTSQINWVGCRIATADDLHWISSSASTCTWWWWRRRQGHWHRCSYVNRTTWTTSTGWLDAKDSDKVKLYVSLDKKKFHNILNFHLLHWMRLWHEDLLLNGDGDGNGQWTVFA